MNARVERLALAVAEPTRMASDLRSVFGMDLSGQGDVLRGPDGYELVSSSGEGGPLRAIVIGVDDLDVVALRLERAGAVRTGEALVDGQREVTFTGTLLGVPVTVRDRKFA